MPDERNNKKAAAGRDDLVRAGLAPGVELRDAGDGTDDGSGQPLHMTGHLAVFNTWTQINSPWEGNFMEQIAPGAFTKTIQENRANIKVLYDHGMSVTGNLPLGPIKELREDGVGCYFDVELLEADYVQQLVPALRAGLLGSSFRFQVVRDEWNDMPKMSADNPKAIPERTIREVKMGEFGCVTFPAYQAATAGVRSEQQFHLWRDLDEEGRSELVRLLIRAESAGGGDGGKEPPAAATAPPSTDPSPEDRGGDDIDPPSTTTTNESETVVETQELRTSEDEVTDDTEPDGAEDVETPTDDAATSSTDDVPAEEPPADRSKTTTQERRKRLLELKGIIS